MSRAEHEKPWWVTALDVLATLLLALAVRATFGHGIRFVFSDQFKISFTSWPRLLAIMAAVLVLRHWLWRRETWLAWSAGWSRRLWRSEAFSATWPTAVLSRVIALGAGYIAVLAIGFNPPPPFRAMPNDILDLFARWDAGWYSTIANVGYHVDRRFFRLDQMNAIAFFPGLPLLMRVFRHALNVDLWTAGILVVSLAFLCGLVCVYRLAREDLPADQARAAVMLLAFYPFAVCYSAILTESLFLLAAAGSFLYLRRGRLAASALFALLGGIVRPNGFLLCVPLGLLAIMPFARARGWLPGEGRAEDADWGLLVRKLAVAVVPVLCVAGYSWYVYSLTGDPFSWAKVQQAWGRTSTGLVDVVAARSQLIGERGVMEYMRQYPVEGLEAGAAVFGLVAVWPIIRRFGLAYGAFVAMAILPPFITMGSISLGRYTAPLFPIFFWLGAAVPERRRPYWIASFAAGQALIAVLFYTWRPPY